MYKISFIGAGNVAYRLSLALQKAGHIINCICNRNSENGEKVVRALKRESSKAYIVNDIAQIPESDVLVIAVSDYAIADIAKQIAPFKDKFKLIVHTSGATDMQILKDASLENCGVFYPLMTLSKNKDIDIRLVPFLLEHNTPQAEEILTQMVQSLKAEYNFCSSEKRLQMHTAAVFGTNFINYILSLAYDVSSPNFTFLLPGAIETVRKAFLNNPTVSQTGPAIRKDMQTLNKHIKVLEDKGLDTHLQVYKMLSEKIMEKYNTEK
ncbi:MAG: DUF2520 domain-containing protein [Bacteroidia bacterium]|nr:DUF2520 domain-containing protein [Bacteroidia bacterium]